MPNARRDGESDPRTDLIEQPPFGRLVLVATTEHVAAELHVAALDAERDHPSADIGDRGFHVGVFDLGVLPYEELREPAAGHHLTVAGAHFGVVPVTVPVHPGAGNDPRRGD